MDVDTLQVSDQAIQQARLLGMYGEVRNRLLSMARHSVPFGGFEHNRRFESYLLKITDGVLTCIGEMGEEQQEEEETPMSSEEDHSSEGAMDLVTCPDCDGDGGLCSTCKDTGKITRNQRRLLEV